MDGATPGRERIPLGHAVFLAPHELRFTFHRSSGPGGQNVNKVHTRVTLHFDVTASPSLTLAQKTRVRRRLATRINRQGVLRVAASRHRTQAANRRAATERFVELMSEALRVRKVRRKTQVPAAAIRKRREEKRRRSTTKEQRRKHYATEE